MPLYLNTRGRTKIAIGICGRCKIKYPYDELVEDGNEPGLWVCKDKGCRDPIDPWRLAPRETEDISLEHARPDLKLGLQQGSTHVYANEIQAVLGTGGGVAVGVGGGGGDIALAPPVVKLLPEIPWQPNTTFAIGAEVTPGVATGFNAAGTEIWRFVCVLPGQSGAMPPVWPTNQGVTVEDGTILWLNNGLFFP
jgi:hypothetical protein